MGKLFSRPQRGSALLTEYGSDNGSSSDIVKGSLHKEEGMWIEVQDGTSQEKQDDTFWEEMALRVLRVSLLWTFFVKFLRNCRALVNQ